MLSSQWNAAMCQNCLETFGMSDMLFAHFYVKRVFETSQYTASAQCALQNYDREKKLWFEIIVWKGAVILKGLFIIVCYYTFFLQFFEHCCMPSINVCLKCMMIWYTQA